MRDNHHSGSANGFEATEQPTVRSLDPEQSWSQMLTYVLVVMVSRACTPNNVVMS
jgi:hypothetical protein